MDDTHEIGLRSGHKLNVHRDKQVFRASSDWCQKVSEMLFPIWMTFRSRIAAARRTALMQVDVLPRALAGSAGVYASRSFLVGVTG